MREEAEITTVFSTKAGRYAGVIEVNMPDIGFLNYKKRLSAFMFISDCLEMYRLDGGDFRLSLTILMIISKTARKAVREGVINMEHLRDYEPLSEAGRSILGIE